MLACYCHFDLQPRDSDVATFSTSIWGPSCDGLDRIMEHCLLPELDCGEWIVFQGMSCKQQSTFC